MKTEVQIAARPPSSPPLLQECGSHAGQSPPSLQRAWRGGADGRVTQGIWVEYLRVKRVTHQKKCSLSLETIKPPPPSISSRPCSTLDPTPTPTPPRPPPSAPTYPPTQQRHMHTTSECQLPPACSLCRYMKKRRVSKLASPSPPLPGSHLRSLFVRLLSALLGDEMQHKNKISMWPMRAAGSGSTWPHSQD